MRKTKTDRIDNKPFSHRPDAIPEKIRKYGDVSNKEAHYDPEYRIWRFRKKQ